MTQDTPSSDPQPAEAWAVLIGCPTVSNARKAVNQILAAELERMAYDIELDCDSHSPEVRTYEWIADRVRRRAKQLRGEA